MQYDILVVLPDVIMIDTEHPSIRLAVSDWLIVRTNHKSMRNLFENLHQWLNNFNSFVLWNVQSVQESCSLFLFLSFIIHSFDFWKLNSIWKDKRWRSYKRTKERERGRKKKRRRERTWGKKSSKYVWTILSFIAVTLVFSFAFFIRLILLMMLYVYWRKPRKIEKTRERTTRRMKEKIITWTNIETLSLNSLMNSIVCLFFCNNEIAFVFLLFNFVDHLSFFFSSSSSFPPFVRNVND